MLELVKGIDFVAAADFLGIVAFAFAGILAAQDKNVDPVGVFVLAFTTAFGGGLLRDVIIDNRPFYWIAHPNFIWMTLGLSLFAPRIIRHMQQSLTRAVFIWSDAIGLGFFSASGTMLSLDAGIPFLPAALLGVCTGVAGGLMRDVFLNRLPLVLSDREPYATSAFLGCWLLIGLDYLMLDRAVSIWVATGFIVSVRMLCWYFHWKPISYFSQLTADGKSH